MVKTWAFALLAVLAAWYFATAPSNDAPAPKTEVLDRICMYLEAATDGSTPPDCKTLQNAITSSYDANSRLSYLEAGDKSKPLIFFVHGFPDSGAMWANQLELFRHSNRVVAVNYPNADPHLPTETDLGPDVVVRRLAKLLGVLQKESTMWSPPKAVVVGHDWGAMLTFALAYHAQEDVGKVITIDVSNERNVLLGWNMFHSGFNTFYQNMFKFSWRSGGQLGAFINRFMLDSFAAFGADVFYAGTVRSAECWPYEFIAYNVGNGGATGAVAAAWGKLEPSIPFTDWERLSSPSALKQPNLHIAGDTIHLFGKLAVPRPQWLSWTSPAFASDAEMVVLPHWHFPHYKIPTKTNAAMQKWLDKSP